MDCLNLLKSVEVRGFRVYEIIYTGGLRSFHCRIHAGPLTVRSIIDRTVTLIP